MYWLNCDIPIYQIRTRQTLLNAGVQLEEDGGEVQAVAISAKLGTNVPALIEAIMTQAEMLQLAADVTGPVEASVIEANTDLVIGKVGLLFIAPKW